MAVIKPGNFSDHRVKALLARHLEGMHANSPPGQVFALDWSGLQKPEISFYTLWEGEDLFGFGALKELDPRGGEIKSMRTADAHLRKGVAARLLDHIIAEARQRGYTRLSLETGSGPAFEPALALYRKYGFTEGGAFGGYEKSAFNRFLHLHLASTQAADVIMRARRVETTMTSEVPTSCVFCRILEGELTPGVVAFRDSHTAVFPSRGQQPGNRGHMLVVPIRHVAHIYEIDRDLAGPLMTTLARVSAAVKKVCSADGVSIRQNNGRHGGQDVFHVHFHVVPRFAGDGFTGLDRALGMVDVSIEERIEQTKKLSDELRRLSST